MITTIMVAVVAAFAVHLLLNTLNKRGSTMSDKEVKPHAHLDQWSVYDWKDIRVLSGIVTGHDRLPDGLFIHTSNVLSLDEEVEMVAETENTFYSLGEKVEAEETS